MRKEFPGYKAFEIEMFVLAEMTDVVSTYPSNFNMKLNDAIADELNRYTLILKENAENRLCF